MLRVLRVLRVFVCGVGSVAVAAAAAVAAPVFLFPLLCPAGCRRFVEPLPRSQWFLVLSLSRDFWL